MEAPSIAIIPSAYKEGVLAAVLPTPVYGPDLVVNGDFATDSDWTKGTGITISGGSANFTGSANANINQDIGLITGKTYKIVFTVSNYVSGDIDYNVGGNTRKGAISANGTYTDYVVSDSGQFLFFQSDQSLGFVGSIDNVSVKEVIAGSADLDFTRGSTATRINAQGLVEDVQILSSNLVSNGDFSQEGSELITNGNFATDSDWSKSGWVIENGKALSSSSGAGNNLYQGNVTLVGKTFKVVIDTTISAGSVVVMLGGGSGGYNVIGEATTSGTFTYYGVSNGTDNRLLLQTGSGSTIGSVSIDNVSVKEVGQDWSFLADFETDGTKAFITNASQYSQLTNQIGVNYLLSGNKYRLTFDIPTLSISGAFAYRYTGGSVTPILTTDIQNGKFTTDFIMPSNGYFWLQTTGSYTGLNVEIDNVSVIEITDDTNLPRINYEDFSYRDVLGSEEIVNGDFSNGSANWIFNNSGGSFGWQIYDGKAICDSNASTPNRNLNSTFSLVNGKSYKLTLDILQSEDNMLIIIGGTTLSQTLPTGTNLNYEYIITDSMHSGGIFALYGGSSDLQEIDNISVKEVTQEIIPNSACPSLLLEPQSTNLITYSEDFSQTDWQKIKSSVTSGFSSPDGGNNAYRWQEDTNSGVHSLKEPFIQRAKSFSLYLIAIL